MTIPTSIADDLYTAGQHGRLNGMGVIERVGRTICVGENMFAVSYVLSEKKKISSNNVSLQISLQSPTARANRPPNRIHRIKSQTTRARRRLTILKILRWRCAKCADEEVLNWVGFDRGGSRYRQVSFTKVRNWVRKEFCRLKVALGLSLLVCGSGWWVENFRALWGFLIGRCGVWDGRIT